MFYALLVFVLAVYGLSNAIAILKFGSPIRKACKPIPIIGTLMCCPPCLAFWIGVGGSIWAFSPCIELVPGNPLLAAFIDGLVASGVVWLLHALAERLTHQIEGI